MRRGLAAATKRERFRLVSRAGLESFETCFIVLSLCAKSLPTRVIGVTEVADNPSLAAETAVTTEKKEVVAVLVKLFTCMRRQNQRVTFSTSGALVAILTIAMQKTLRFTLLASLLAALPAAAQNWSVGGGTGAFVFGDFVVRTLRATTGGATSTSEVRLSGRTRPGLSVDVERSFSDRFAMRLEGTFTHAPMVVKDEGGGTVDLDAGKLDVATFAVPLVFRINPRGAVRFHLMAGPAYAEYRIKHRTSTAPELTVFEGTRGRWGVAAGAGIAWWLSERVALEGQITDITTSSPFERSEIIASGQVRIPRTKNVHTTVGARWRF